ncbi:MAG: type II toxin-antitoxin system HicB family antitoxin [Planctomycetaceae bacterium]|nr:type II toxin-antitoxin system HicB family antitoxin [Planctomycetaceae bacterium]
MASVFILSDYLHRAMAAAEYDKLDDGSYAGRIPVCPGVLTFGPTLPRCEDELRSTLEDWLLVGLKLGHPLPVLDGIDLNEEPRLEPLDAV